MLLFITVINAMARSSSKRYVPYFFFNDTATTEIYTRPYTLSLHDALPICTTATARTSAGSAPSTRTAAAAAERPSSRSGVPVALRSEEHTSELQSHGL